MNHLPAVVRYARRNGPSTLDCSCGVRIEAAANVMDTAWAAHLKASPVDRKTCAEPAIKSKTCGNSSTWLATDREGILEPRRLCGTHAKHFARIRRWQVERIATVVSKGREIRVRPGSRPGMAA